MSITPQDRLKRQLELLWKHCRDFDSGSLSAAIEMATRLRVILHSTRSSTSAIKHLNGENIKLLSTARPDDRGQRCVVAEGGLTIYKGSGWVAALDEARHRNEIGYDAWWNEEIIAIYKEFRYTRSIIVKDAANQDDGAHIVNTQKGRLAKLTNGPWRLLTNDGNGHSSTTVLRNQHFQYLRQIAYEVLHSEDLLELVHPQFRLPTDKEVRLKQEADKEQRAERIGRLYATARRLLGEGDVNGASVIASSIVSEITERSDERIVRHYLLSKWLLAEIAGKQDPIASRTDLEAIVSEIEVLIQTGLHASKVVDIYVRARYIIGLLYAQSGDRTPSETHWRYVCEICRKNIAPSDKINVKEKAEPISYFLQSANGIAVHALNRGEFASVVEILSDALSFIRQFSEDLVSHWTYDRINAEIGEPHGKDIAYQIFKASSNLSIAQFSLGHVDAAKTDFANYVERFMEADDASIAIRIQDIARAFNQDDDAISSS